MTRMYAALLVAVAVVSAMTPPAPVPAVASPARWEAFAGNPAWEVYGREDATGVFIYTERRLKQPVLNFGVNLAPKAIAGAPMVLGNDDATARLLMARPKGATTQPMKAGAKSTAPCGHGDCPNNECRRKPRPRPPIDVDITPHFEFHPIHAVFALVGIVAFLGFWATVIVICVIVYRLTRRAVSTTPPPPQ